ncbi:MAG: hypothetical protein GYB55_15035 [Cytophagales bacterium]|uniref:hypothetical protein n=1 Tax=Cyclobacterium marinum TaxID=104 RepID=UPI0011ED6B0D|nr:hypothetical protein [Cyclobacterium marinum]MBI0398393.1 hypothetical protein [Cyclobacterium marinum]MBR9776254.1 hypothetical protein [Cytophagales bacterium]|tara:strand:- start:104407 stop:104919 length:513 start_codon:yes stop_codon:yes gene_type:complete
MHLFNYKRRNLGSGIHLLGAILLMASAMVLLSSVFIEAADDLHKTLWVGISAFSAGLIIINTYEGTLIDLENKNIKEYFSFCGFKSGKWNKLPAVRTIKLVPIEEKTSNTPNGISPTISSIKFSYQIIISFFPNNLIYTYSYNSKSEAKKKYKLLLDNLLIDEINGSLSK